MAADVAKPRTHDEPPLFWGSERLGQTRGSCVSIAMMPELGFVRERCTMENAPVSSAAALPR
jgi:hypothetical protein